MTRLPKLTDIGNARKRGILQKFLLATLLLGLVSACKPDGRTLEPITGGRRDTGGSNSGLDGAVDPTSIVAILENVPEGDSPVTDLEIQVSGDNLTHYTYKIGPALTTECELAYDYILMTINAPIIRNIEQLPDGEIRVCVVGQHANGLWQPYERSTIATWRKATGALESPENLVAITAAQRVSLVWERPQGVAAFIVARSGLPIDWQPEDGEVYEVGNLEENLDIVYAGDLVSHIDNELTDSQSYYYAVYSHDLSYRYSPPATVAAIPSPDVFAWVPNAPGAFLRDAVIGGRRFDDSRNLYVCRITHSPGGVSFGHQVGKFVPAAPGDLSNGDCYVAFNNQTIREQQNYEIMVVTRGRFEDWFQWTPFGAQFPAVAFVAGQARTPDEEINMYVCRFLQNQQHFVPGKVSPASEEGCEADIFSFVAAERGVRSSTNFQILIRRSL